MTEPNKRPAQDSLGDAFLKAIDYHTREYQMTYDEVIGCLEIVKLGMYREMCEKEDEYE